MAACVVLVAGSFMKHAVGIITSSSLASSRLAMCYHEGRRSFRSGIIRKKGVGGVCFFLGLNCK